MKTLLGKCLLGVLALTIGIQSHAEIKYWDGNGATAGAGTAPAGNFATSAFWTSTEDGTGTPALWVAGDDAVFSAGTNATGAYTVTLGSATAASITVEEGTVALGGSGGITIGTGTVTVNSNAILDTSSSARISAIAGSKLILKGGHKRTSNTGAAGSFVDVDMVIELQGGGTLSYSVPNVLNIVQTGVAISGTGPLTKSGVGVLAFANTCTYSGATLINDGELRIRTTANRLPTGTDVVVTSPGILNLNGVAQQIGSLAGNGNVGLSGATLTIGGTSNTTYSGSIRTTANAGAGGSTATGGSVTKQGNGILTLTGTNSFTSLLTMTAGGIKVEPSGFLCDPVADVLINGGTLTLSNAAQTIENLGGSGGAIVLGAGHTLTINPINAARSSTYSGAISGAGGITKIGATTETLLGTNSYTGPTVVQEGKLVTTTVSTGAGTYTVADSATLGVKVGSPGTSLNMSALTLGTSPMEFDFASLGTPTATPAKVNGDIAVNGTVLVSAKGFETPGTFTLLEYTGTRSGSGSFTLGNVPVRMFGNIIDDTANKKVILEVTGGDNLIWVSDVNGFWDLNNTANEIWQLSTGGSPTYYQENTMQGDVVRFDDTATGTPIVTLNDTLSPYKVTVDNSSQDYTFTGAGKISGPGSLTKSGSRPLTILTTNDYSGGTTLNAAKVVIGNNSVFGSGTVTINDAVLQSDSASTRTLSMPVILNGDIVAAEAGNLTFQTGLWTITGESREITVDSMNLAINSVIAQDAAGRGLIKKGAGTLSLAAANTFSGGIVLDEGTLRVNSNNGLGTTGSPVTLADGVTLATTGGTGRTINHAFTLNGGLTLGQASGGTAAITVAGTLNLAGGVRTISISNATDTISAVISNGGLLKTSAGNLDLSAANTFTGGFQHTEGTVRVGNNAALGAANSSVTLSPSVTLAANSGTGRTLTYNYTVNGDFTLGQASGGTGALTLAGAMNLGGAERTITVANNSDTISAAISNGGIIKAGNGTLTLTGTNTYAGGTTVNEGTLQGSTVGLQGNIVNNTKVTFNQSTAGTYAGEISGPGEVTKVGTGAVTLSGANSYSGNTTVTAGSLLIDGTIASATVSVTNATLGGSGTIAGPVTFSNGFLSPGGTNIGTLTLAGGLTLSGSTNIWQLGALKDDANGVAGVDFDQISLTGGPLDAGAFAVLLVSFADPSIAPDFATPFWQASHKWTVVKMNGGFNFGSGFQVVVTGTPVHAGTFSTEVEGDGSLSLTFTPAGPTAPILLADLSNKTVAQNSPATFTIGVTGSAPLSYRWFFNGAEQFTETTSSFNRNAANISDEGQYYVIVSNNEGSLTSSVATLTVILPPVIQTQPESQTVEPGADVTFSVVASGTAPFSYQWRFAGGNIASATNSSYTITGVATNNAGAYSVTVTNLAGSVLSSDAILTVGTAGPTITSLTVTNNVATLVWTAATNKTYRAQFKPTVVATNWTDIAPDVTATSNSVSVTNPTDGANERFYRVLVLP